MSTEPKTPSILLTDEDVINLLDCAGYGIGYWAITATVDEDAKTYRVIESGAELDDGETPEDKTLTFDQLREAFNILATKDLLPDWQMREIANDDLGFDSLVGDITVQQAMFGEIIYG